MQRTKDIKIVSVGEGDGLPNPKYDYNIATTQNDSNAFQPLKD